MRVAVIGGTGVDTAKTFGRLNPYRVATPYGEVEMQRTEGSADELFLLRRHGAKHNVPPQEINYRANIWALNHLRVDAVIATAAVGSLRLDMRPGDFVILDSFIDFTSGRHATFYDGDHETVVHTDMTQPYDAALRQGLIRVGQGLAVPVHTTGCYVCTNGPRYESPAEVKAFALLGGDVVGMTGVPEVVLARELDLRYATLAVVTNYGAGLSEEQLAHDDVVEQVEKQGEVVSKFLRGTIELLRQTSLAL